MGQCHVPALGVAVGAVCALYFFCLGVFGMFGWGAELVTALGSLYIGYEATLLGSVIGALWAFAEGFVAGALVAWIYNKVARL